MHALRAVGAWLFDRPSCSRRTRSTLSVLAFLAFVALVVVGALHHEIWRDEARALTLALEPEHVWGLFGTLENEGHPALWHVLLRLVHGVVPTPVVLPVLTASIGISAAALVFFTAPLPAWWRAAFVFGWVPLYGGSILCRNYGIGLLLLFTFCRFMTTATPRVLSAATTLALLANTNVYGTMMAGGLGAFLAVEALRRRARPRTIAAAALVVAAGVAVAVWTMSPTPESKLLPAVGAKLPGSLGSVLTAIGDFPGATLWLFRSEVLAWATMLLLLTATSSLPHLAVATAAVFAVAAWFMRSIYGASPHHLTMTYAFLAAVTWIRAGHRPVATPSVIPRVSWRVLLYVVWPLLLALHAFRGLREVHYEIELQRSSSPELARLLDRPDLADAVLVGEPDYFLDVLPYYRDNRIYLARESTFRRRVSWTTANRRELDLGDLLTTARTLRESEHTPILVVLGRQIELARPSGEIVHGYGDRFRWSPEQREEFLGATERIASLPARPSRLRGDETYTVYRLLDPRAVSASPGR